jgi:hypothetical protein
MCREIAERAEGRKGWDLVGVRFSFVAVINSHRRHFQSSGGGRGL